MRFWLPLPALMYIFSMVDYETLIAALQQRGYNVHHAMEVPSNAGTAELMVNGKLITLEEARELLADAEPK